MRDEYTRFQKSPVAKATRRPKNQEKHSNHLRLPLD
jgi:hypothetical protein